DFDDAVYAEAKGKNIAVTVAIADVSHYVKIGSALDEEALERGTSIYYPGHCIPMLPEQLSNGLCSLKPKVPRLALAVTFEVGSKGGISHAQIREAVIESKARLTYNQVQDFYDGKEQLSIPKAVGTSLLFLQKAALLLRRHRERRGAIDFDITESVVALNDAGEPLAVHPQLRLESHRIIEDLMVATNEIVASFFENKKIPSVYRVHEPPNEEKLENFFKTAQAFGAIKASSKAKALSFTEPRALQAVMNQYQKSQFKETLNTLMLRAMMQARYSEKNLMHFGLASPAYLHFTSPIRRYADLIVHRQLRSVLFEKKPEKKIPEYAMAEIANSVTEREIKATDLERKIDRLFSATFMASRVGETFDGVIVACTEFGFFVRVIAHHIEGLVHIATISKSHVIFVPEKMCLVVTGSNKKYMVGDKVRVKLVNVNTDRGHIDFELVQEKAAVREKPQKKPELRKARKPQRSRKTKSKAH
ncbi:MAG TPA: VacB/RNase II family 3'-5' exoribonuclease, partial [Myxococcota bacterium]|nr:VacB/RNase II family 3'-5' exoribonuclease [Myxococcota bacterium]